MDDNYRGFFDGEFYHNWFYKVTYDDIYSYDITGDGTYV